MFFQCVIQTIFRFCTCSVIFFFLKERRRLSLLSVVESLVSPAARRKNARHEEIPPPLYIVSSACRPPPHFPFLSHTGVFSTSEPLHCSSNPSVSTNQRETEIFHEPALAQQQQIQGYQPFKVNIRPPPLFVT